MDTRNGEIYMQEKVDEMFEKEKKYFMQINPSYAQLMNGRIGRNAPCPCGSGKKFKRCCLKSIK